MNAKVLQDEPDAALSPLLETFNVQGKQLDPVQQSYYTNVTGFIHGKTKLTNITLPSLAMNQTLAWRSHAERFMQDVNTTYLVERLGSWDWESTKRMSLSLREKPPLGTEQLPDSQVSLVHVGHIERSRRCLLTVP